MNGKSTITQKQNFGGSQDKYLKNSINQRKKSVDVTSNADLSMLNIQKNLSFVTLNKNLNATTQAPNQTFQDPTGTQASKQRQLYQIQQNPMINEPQPQNPDRGNAN